RFRRLRWHRLGIERLLRGSFAQAAERPLAIDQPRIEYENQTERGPARLIGADFVKIIRVAKERMNRGEQEGDSREGGDEQGGKPKPPLASRNFLRIRFWRLNAEAAGALERRGFWLACGCSQE